MTPEAYKQICTQEWGQKFMLNFKVGWTVVFNRLTRTYSPTRIKEGRKSFVKMFRVFFATQFFKSLLVANGEMVILF